MLDVINSNSIGVHDLRANKRLFFLEAIKALSKVTPIGFSSTESNPIQVIDFFSGAGGMSLGFAAINEVLINVYPQGKTA